MDQVTQLQRGEFTLNLEQCRAIGTQIQRIKQMFQPHRDAHAREQTQNSFPTVSQDPLVPPDPVDPEQSVYPSGNVFPPPS